MIVCWRYLRFSCRVIYFVYYPERVGRHSDSLRAERSGDRIAVGARFSAPVQTGPGAQAAPYTVGTGSFPGVKRPERGVDHPRLSSAEVKERVEIYLHYFGSSWQVIGRTSPLTFSARCVL